MEGNSRFCLNYYLLRPMLQRHGCTDTYMTQQYTVKSEKYIAYECLTRPSFTVEVYVLHTPWIGSINYRKYMKAEVSIRFLSFPN